MIKTPLEMELDKTILEFYLQEISPLEYDSRIEELIVELGDDVRSLREQDLLRLLAKAEFNIYILLEERLNLSVELGRAVKNFSSSEETALHSFSKYTNTEVSDLINEIEVIRKAFGSDLGTRGANARIKRDPKQIEKKFVFSCWEKWQENPNNYKSKAAFSRDMLTKCMHLTSQKKIEDWCREWEKEHLAG